MPEHRVRVEWTRGGETFEHERFDRRHEWISPGGTRIEASSAPDFLGDASCFVPSSVRTEVSVEPRDES